MSTLYENIMSLCDSRGIKGGKLCTDIGISKGILTDLKSGRKTGMSAITAQKIASYFNVSVGYLLGEEEKENAPGELVLTKDEIRILQAFRGMSLEKRKALALFLGEDDPQK